MYVNWFCHLVFPRVCLLLCTCSAAILIPPPWWMPFDWFLPRPRGALCPILHSAARSVFMKSRADSASLQLKTFQHFLSGERTKDLTKSCVICVWLQLPPLCTVFLPLSSLCFQSLHNTVLSPPQVASHTFPSFSLQLLPLFCFDELMPTHTSELLFWRDAFLTLHLVFCLFWFDLV